MALNIVQLYQSTILDLDSDNEELAVQVTVIPKNAFTDPIELDSTGLIIELDSLGFNAQGFSSIHNPVSLPFAIVEVLLEGTSLQNIYFSQGDGTLTKSSPINNFVQHISFAEIIPYEESPLRKKSLGNILAEAIATGAFLAGVVTIKPPIPQPPMPQLPTSAPVKGLVIKARDGSVVVLERAKEIGTQAAKELPGGFGKGLGGYFGAALGKKLLERRRSADKHRGP